MGCPHTLTGIMARRSTATETTASERRRKVAAFYLEGKPQSQIARLVKVNQSTVSRDLEAVRAAWLASAVLDYNTKKAEELARIDHLEAEAWEAWHRSKKCRTTEQTKQVTFDDGTRAEESTKKEYRDGAAEYLRVVQWCIEQRCTILGLDAPKQFQFVGAVAVTVEESPPALSPDDLAQLADLAIRAGVLGPPPQLGPPEASRNGVSPPPTG